MKIFKSLATSCSHRAARAMSLVVIIASACAERQVTDPHSGAIYRMGVPVEAPPPEVLETYAARLPPCASASAPQNGVPVRLEAAPARLWLPPGFHAEPDSLFQEWRGPAPDSTHLTVSVNEGGGTFIVAGEPGRQHAESRCSLRVGGRLGTVDLSLLVNGADTVYVAAVNAGIRRGLWIGAGITSSTAKGRHEALAVLATLTVEPEN